MSAASAIAPEVELPYKLVPTNESNPQDGEVKNAHITPVSSDGTDCFCAKYWFCYCPFCIPENHYGVIENCGRFSALAPAGLLWLNYPFGRVRHLLSLKVQQLAITCDAKSKDNVFIRVAVAVIFRINPSLAAEAYYKLANPMAQMRALVTDGVRTAFPRMDLDDCFLSKDEVSSYIKQHLKDSMAPFGYDIVDVLLADIDPDARVKNAMNEINASQRMRQAAAFKADAEKILLVKAAEADSESKYLVGVGVAKQRKAIIDNSRNCIDEMTKAVEGTGASEAMNMLLLTQYFDTLKDLGGKKSTGEQSLFMPHAPAAVSGLRNEMNNTTRDHANAATRKKK